MEDYFIWTEIVNTGKIGKIALASFCKYHPNIKVHVYGMNRDFGWLGEIPDNMECISVDNQTAILEAFNQGHLGTAMLWSGIISQNPQKYFIHFDSDVIFRKECMSDLLDIRHEYDLIGKIRSYKHNPHNRDDIRDCDDVVATDIFLFNKEKIGEWDAGQLTAMIRGYYNPHPHPFLLNHQRLGVRLIVHLRPPLHLRCHR